MGTRLAGLGKEDRGAAMSQPTQSKDPGPEAH
jgi:hypothetical protein